MILFLRILVLSALFLTLAVPLFVNPSLVFPFVTGRTFLFRILVGIASSGWLILALLDPKYRPRKSPILVLFTALLGSVFVSSLFAHDRQLAIWGDFERMDGLLMIFHVWAFFVVLATMLEVERAWRWFLNVSLGVALVAVVQGLSSLTELPGERFEGLFGNPSYMAVYLLFQAGIAGYLALQAPQRGLKVLYGVLAALFIGLILFTGTRGTILGLGVGIMTGMIYLAIRGAQFPELRRAVLGAIIASTLAGGTFVALKDSAFVQGNPVLARTANLDIAGGINTRLLVWNVAWEAFKERPVLGWGLGGFSYAYAKHFDPRLLDRDPWFDRVHNIVLDWMIFGGAIGLLLYLALLLSPVFAAVRPSPNARGPTFTIPEQALLISLLVAYVVHNLVIFDVLVSYLFFAVVLAIVHGRTSSPWTRLEALSLPSARVELVLAPIIVVASAVAIYAVNIPHQAAARELVAASSAGHDPRLQYTLFDQALRRKGMDQELVVEQLAIASIARAQTEEIPASLRDDFFQRTEAELEALMAGKPGDARLHSIAAEFYRVYGQLDQAAYHVEAANALAPRHQQVVTARATLLALQGDRQAANEVLREAHLLDPAQYTPLRDYITDLLEIGMVRLAETEIEGASEAFMTRFAQEIYPVDLLIQYKSNRVLAKIFEYRVAALPDNAEGWISLSALYLEDGNPEMAINTLERAIGAIPSIRPVLECFIGNIRAGRDPEEGCV